MAKVPQLQGWVLTGTQLCCLIPVLENCFSLLSPHLQPNPRPCGWEPMTPTASLGLVLESCCLQKQVFWHDDRMASPQVLGHWLSPLPGLPHQLVGCDLLLKLGLIRLPSLNPWNMVRLSCITDLNSHLPATCLVGFCLHSPPSLPIFRNC